MLDDSDDTKILCDDCLKEYHQFLDKLEMKAFMKIVGAIASSAFLLLVILVWIMLDEEELVCHEG